MRALKEEEHLHESSGMRWAAGNLALVMSRWGSGARDEIQAREKSREFFHHFAFPPTFYEIVGGSFYGRYKQTDCIHCHSRAGAGVNGKLATREIASGVVR